MGKTMFASNEMCSFALENNDTLSWWVAPIYRQAKIAYRMMRKALADVTVRHSDTELRLELINGSIIECRSADNPDNLRGEGIYFMVLEEAAMLPSKLWYEVLRPMLSGTNGRAVFISTPRGRNWFYDVYVRGQDPLYPDWWSITLPTSENPFIPASEIEEARRDLPEDVFRQEYLAAFLAESAGVFRNIDACIYGPYTELPYNPRHSYMMGWDVAKYQDFSVITVMDATIMQVVYWWRSNHIDYTFQLSQVATVAKRYAAYVLMDVTGVGNPLLEQLQKTHGLGNMAEGFLFTNTSKKILVEDLALGFQNVALHIPQIEVMIAEIRQTEYKFTPTRQIYYGAPDGAHDDCMISLALAYHASARPRVPLSGYEAEQNEIEVPTIKELAQVDPFSWASQHGYMDYDD